MEYSQCCVTGCTRLPCVGVKAGNVLIFYCVKHIAQGLSTKQSLLKGISPKDIPGISPKRVELIGQIRKKKKIKRDKTVATKAWDWVDEFDYWRSAAGKRTRISKLETDELIDAIVTIAAKYVDRYTSKTAWVRELYSNREQLYVYPIDKFTVSKSDALAKLDEMYEEARFRGLV